MELGSTPINLPSNLHFLKNKNFSSLSYMLEESLKSHVWEVLIFYSKKLDAWLWFEKSYP